MTIFRRGLKENVKDKLMRDGRITPDLKVLIDVAIDIDDKLYKRAIEKRHNGFQPRGRGGYNFQGGR